MTAPEPRRRVQVRKDQSPDAGPYPWHFTVEWEPREEYLMDCGDAETWEEALRTGLESLACEREFREELERVWGGPVRQADEQRRDIIEP